MPVRPLLGVVVISFYLMFLVPAGSDAKSPKWTKLVASESEANDHFGIAVDVDGNYAIIGAACDDDMGTDSGSAYIFRKDGADWVEQQKLVAADGLDGDWFGCSVSINGDYAIVGARYGDSDVAVDSGTAYIFWNNGTSWVQQAKLIAEDAYNGACFGISVSIDGHKAIVGAFCTIDGGASYIFRRDGANWSQEKRLMAKDSAPGDSFGRSVVISGDRVVIGADGYEDKGTAYIFKWNDVNWLQEQRFTTPDIRDYDWFGRSVSISGDRAIVGAYCNDNDKGIDAGLAYIFKRDGTNWVLEQKLTASDGDTKDWLGYSVSLNGDYAIIGANCDDDKGNDSGSAYIFKWDGTRWVQKQKLTAPDGNAQDWFGRSVSISGDKVIVGAMWDDDKGDNSGSAYIFELIN